MVAILLIDKLTFCVLSLAPHPFVTKKGRRRKGRLDVDSLSEAFSKSPRPKPIYLQTHHSVWNKETVDVIVYFYV